MTPAGRPAIEEFATWEPTLRLLREANARTLDAPGGHVSGYIGHHARSVPFRPVPSPSQLGRALQVSDMQEEHDAVRKVSAALTEAGMDSIGFKAEISSHGHCALRLFTAPSSIEARVALGTYPGTIIRYKDAAPEPMRRMPDPNPTARPHASADPALLERVLRERFPNASGATDEEIAAAEARLGLAFPEELRAVYRVVRGPADVGDADGDWNTAYAIVCEMLAPLEDVAIGSVASRYPSWSLASKAIVTPPYASVQQLIGSPGWIVFGDDHGSARYAIDLTPGPLGHIGQIIGIPVDEFVGAFLQAHSLTDFVQGRFAEDASRRDEAPAIAHVNIRSLESIAAAAHPDLEVLSIGVWESEPLSLAPVIGLPKLRTLIAYPGTLTDPLEIAELTSLEYLELGPREWRTLLDAKAVPDSLLAAQIIVRGNPVPLPQPDPVAYIALANEILALWNGPQISETIIDGHLR